MRAEGESVDEGVGGEAGGGDGMSDRRPFDDSPPWSGYYTVDMITKAMADQVMWVRRVAVPVPPHPIPVARVVVAPWWRRMLGWTTGGRR